MVYCVVGIVCKGRVEDFAYIGTIRNGSVCFSCVVDRYVSTISGCRGGRDLNRSISIGGSGRDWVEGSRSKVRVRVIRGIRVSSSIAPFFVR